MADLLGEAYGVEPVPELHGRVDGHKVEDFAVLALELVG